jgi:pantoate--beta-alanine ligase
LYRALSAVQNAFQHGEKDAGKLRAAMRDTLAAEPLAKIEYVSASNPDTLQELAIVGQNALFSMAVRIGKTRLIDNFMLRDGTWDTGART